MRRPFVLLPLILATAAFSECGPRAASMHIDGPELVRGVAEGDSLRCPVTLTARLGTNGGGAAEWTRTEIFVIDENTGTSVAHHTEDAAATATHWSDARLERGATATGTFSVLVPAPARVEMTVWYRMVAAGSLVDAQLPGMASFAFRCIPPDDAAATNRTRSAIR